MSHVHVSKSADLAEGDCYLPIKQVAKKLAVNIRYVQDLIREGSLPVYRLSYKIHRVKSSDVDDLLRRAMATPSLSAARPVPGVRPKLRRPGQGPLPQPTILVDLDSLDAPL